MILWLITTIINYYKYNNLITLILFKFLARDQFEKLVIGLVFKWELVKKMSR